MPLLIDAYNVLHTVGVLPADLAGIDVPGLIGLLNASRYRGEKTTIVCDGVADPGLPPLRASDPIFVRYSGKGREADELIGQSIRASSAPRQLIVVSSDHAVQRAARRRRCKVLSSAEFLQQLVDDVLASKQRPGTAAGKPPPASMSQEQVDRWVNIFNLTSDVVAIPPQMAVEPEPAPAPARGDEPSPPPPPSLPARGPVLPPSLIEQAEQLWAKEQDKG